MKLQDVILKAMAKSLTWMEAAEIAGMSVRNMQRMRQRYQEGRYNGLFDQQRGKRGIHRIPMATAEWALAPYRDQYFDRNMRHFHEKLKEVEGIRLSDSWVKQALQGAGRGGLCRKRAFESDPEGHSLSEPLHYGKDERCTQGPGETNGRERGCSAGYRQCPNQFGSSADDPRRYTKADCRNANWRNEPDQDSL